MLRTLVTTGVLWLVLNFWQDVLVILVCENDGVVATINDDLERKGMMVAVTNAHEAVTDNFSTDGSSRRQTMLYCSGNRVAIFHHNVGY